MIHGSPIMSFTIFLGCKDENGSWKIICMFRRSSLSSCPFNSRMFLPSNRTLPAVGSISLRTVLPRVVFPQPDSPASPNISPFLTSKLMPSTAFTYPTTFSRRPPLTGKYFVRFSVLRSELFSMVDQASPYKKHDTECPGLSVTDFGCLSRQIGIACGHRG